MSKLMLPVDVVFDILSFLPVKSLLRLRCLSNSFSRLIDSPDFINFHLNLSIKTKTNRSLLINNISRSCGSIYEVDLDSPVVCVVKMDLQDMVRVPFRRSTRDEFEFYGDIFGTCNGLVAMEDNQGIILWNPSTKKHRFVPKFWTGEVYFNNGFGYDVITNDYKVIIVTRARVHNKNYNYSVVVYSLKTNSSKRIHNSPPPNYYERDNRMPSVLVGSYVHWLVGNFYYNTVILAFDLGNEKFNEVSTPNLIDEVHKSTAKMVCELGGCLSMNYASV